MPLLTKSHDTETALEERVSIWTSRFTPLKNLGVEDENLNDKRIEKLLHNTVSLEDFYRITELELRTEAATNQYDRIFVDSSKKHGALWLGRYNQELWSPDERTHRLPFAQILRHGFEESTIEGMIHDSEEGIPYKHESGDHPVSLVTFGMIQEFLTDKFYETMLTLIRPMSEIYAGTVTAVQKREKVHTGQYMTMLSILLKDDPAFVEQAAYAVAHFQMPSNILAPQLQKHANEWITMAGGNLQESFNGAAGWLYKAVRESPAFGRMVVAIGEELGVRIGGVPIRFLRSAANRFGRHVYGVIGEATMQAIGLEKEIPHYTGLQGWAHNAGRQIIASRFPQPFG